MKLRLAPVTLKKAVPFNSLTHRRLPKLQGAMWAVGCFSAEELIGVAIVGLPVGQWSPAEVTLSVLRVAVVPGHPNACSMLYGAVSRMVQACGADNLVTYTHLDENGASLKGSNWIDGGLTDGGEHSRPTRQRALAIDADQKRRWWAPWSKRAQKSEAK